MSNPKKSPIAPDTGNKKQSRFLKLLGSGILLTSFIAQNYFLEMWKEQSAMMVDASRDQALIDKGTLLNEILYFTAKPGAGAFDSSELENVRAQYLQMAAIKTAGAMSVRIATGTRTMSDTAKASQINEFREQAKRVVDFKGFSELNDKVNKFNIDFSVENQKHIRDIDSKRDFWRWIYIISSIIGSVFLLAGIWYE